MSNSLHKIHNRLLRNSVTRDGIKGVIFSRLFRDDLVIVVPLSYHAKSIWCDLLVGSKHHHDGKSVDLKIVQTVFSLELLNAAHTRCAKVDADNLSRGPTQGMLGRLRCAAAGDEDGVVFLVRSGGPKQVIIRAASLLVLPELLIFFQGIDRPRIGIPFREVSDFLPRQLTSIYSASSSQISASIQHERLEERKGTRATSADHSSVCL